MNTVLRRVALILGFSLAANSVSAQSFVGSSECADCHADVAELWAGSHHALAWTPTTEDTVLGDFTGSAFEGEGMSVRFGRDGDGFTIEVTDTDGQTTTYPVHSVAGVAPLQQYLLETEPGRQQSFDVVWDVEREEWYHLYPGDGLVVEDALHWTGPYKTWNARCAECHATDYRRAYSPRARRYNSTAAEWGVGCESCHGGGADHVEWARSGDAEMPPAAGFSMAFGQGITEAEIQQCAGCHSRRENLTDGNPIPGTPYHDTYRLALLRPGLYHADGQILDEVYVYGSFLQSRMYAQGVGCMNCHDPHDAGLVAEGNAVCTQCHSPAGNPEFETLRPADYDDPAHHFHSEGTEGAQCKSCHMIERTYMGVDGRRDHSFRVPRPDLAGETGGPDACTDCHEDRTADWAASEIAQRFPDSAHRGPHYGQVLARGRINPQQAAQDLVGLAGDTAQPGIVRATALYLLQSGGQFAMGGGLLTDPDPLVRAEALSMLQAAPPEVKAQRVTPLLGDPVRSVRIAAARQMLNVPPDALSPSQRALLGEAMRDWQRSIGNKLDYPETHMVLGGMALQSRNTQAAESAFRETLRLDPQRSDAWSILIRLIHATRSLDEARVVLRQGLAVMPADPVLLELQRQMGG
ncbi:MAG: multiheme c-type cytochrome [Paracoccaceae bacterium]